MKDFIIQQGKWKVDLYHNFKMALGIPVLTRYCLFIIRHISCQLIYKNKPLFSVLISGPLSYSQQDVTSAVNKSMAV